LRLGDHEDDASTGGWFKPGPKSSPQAPDPGAPDPVRDTDPAPVPWSASARPASEHPLPVRPPAQGNGWPGPDAEDTVAGQWAPGPGSTPAGGFRGETAAHNWAEVTRGGTPAAVNPNRQPSLPERSPRHGREPAFGDDADRSFGDDWDSRAARAFGGNSDLGDDRPSSSGRAFGGSGGLGDDRSSSGGRAFGGDGGFGTSRPVSDDWDSRGGRGFGGGGALSADRAFGGDGGFGTSRPVSDGWDSRDDRGFGGDRGLNGDRAFGGDGGFGGRQGLKGDEASRDVRGFGDGRALGGDLASGGDGGFGDGWGFKGGGASRDVRGFGDGRALGGDLASGDDGGFRGGRSFSDDWEPRDGRDFSGDRGFSDDGAFGRDGGFGAGRGFTDDQDSRTGPGLPDRDRRGFSDGPDFGDRDLDVDLALRGGGRGGARGTLRTGRPPWESGPDAVGRASRPASADVPFEGVRAIDVSAPHRGQSRRAPGYGPAQAARPMARRTDSGTGALRRIRDTGAMRTIMDTNAMRVLMDTSTMQALRERYAGRGRAVAAVVITFWVVVAATAIALSVHHDSAKPTAGPTSSPTARTAVSTGPTTGKKAAGTASATKKPGSSSGHPGTSPVRLLTVVGAEAFGPRGASDGDNPSKASLVLHGGGVTPWRTHVYATAHFGGLQEGTGLVLDMGQEVTVSKVTLELASGSATVTVRVGNTPVPGTFTPMGVATGVGGTVTLTAAKPLRGHYVEIWFSRLPQDPAGGYEESVYSVKVTGQS
jgi:hypothetical protein